jgi:hypothetical protein
MKNNKIILFVKNFIKNFNKEKIILISIFSILWYYLLKGVELDSIPSFIQCVLKGLIIAMINISIIYNKLSEKGLILYCIMPFIIGVLLCLFKSELLVFITFANLFLIDINNIFNRFNDYINILKKFNINSLKLFFNELVNNYLHTLGGTPEPTNKALAKPGNVNYRTPEGEPSRPTATRPSSPAGSEGSDLYGSGGNSPEASGRGGENSEVGNNWPTNTWVAINRPLPNTNSSGVVTGNSQTGSGIVGGNSAESSGVVANTSEATLPESTNNKRKRITRSTADLPTQTGSDATSSNKRRRISRSTADLPTQTGSDAIASNQSKRITRSTADLPTQKSSGVTSSNKRITWSRARFLSIYDTPIPPANFIFTRVSDNTPASSVISHDNTQPVQTANTDASANNQARPVTISPFTSVQASGAVGENSGVGSGVSSEVVETNSNVGVSSGLVGTSSSIGFGVSANNQASKNSPLASGRGVSSGVSSSVHANIDPRLLAVIDPRLLGDVVSGNNPQVRNTSSIPSIANIPQVSNTSSIPPIANIGSNPIYLPPILDSTSSVVVRADNFFEYRPVTSLFTNPEDALVGTTNSYIRDYRNIVAIEVGHKRQNFNDALNLAYARLDIHCRHIPDNQKLSKLQPLIAELVSKVNDTYQLTISDVAELKYILSLSNHQTGLNVKSQGLYNRYSMKHGNSVHTSLNIDSRSKKLLILDDLRAIQAGISNNNQ